MPQQENEAVLGTRLPLARLLAGQNSGSASSDSDRKGEWDGVYRWEAGNHAGEAATLKEAKHAVEQAVLVGASQLPLFE